VYGNVKELFPEDAPEPLRKGGTLTTYVDANLFHDQITGRSVTEILHLINKTPFDWYSKCQATIETATYGSEFTAARIAVNQIQDICTTLGYLGVPINRKTCLFGDNQAVVKSSTVPHSTLTKRHNALAFLQVRKAMASGMISFIHIGGKANPADALSKHWGFASVWPVLKPLLYWKGTTQECTDGSEISPHIHD
jgi:hypothetical protein